jgi:hypothetical protein
VSAPETSASLHDKRAGLQLALKAALIAGNPTQKLRSQLAEIDRQLAAIAHSDAIAAEAVQRAADERIEAAGQAIATETYERLEVVMADFEILQELPMVPDTTAVRGLRFVLPGQGRGG